MNHPHSSCRLFRNLAVTLAAALLVVGLPSIARAIPIQVTATGVVNNTNMNAFVLNQSVTFTMIYESSGSPQFIANGQGFYVDHLSYVHIKSGAYDTAETGVFGQINLVNGISSTDGISWQIAANAATYQYTNPRPGVVHLANVTSNNVVQSFDSMYFNLYSSNASLWSTFDLPTTFNYSDFDTTHNMSFSFSGGGFSVGLQSVTIGPVDTGAASVPDTASTAALTLMALLGLAAIHRKA